MRQLRFAADAMLGRLAKWLRIAGYDTVYYSGIDDAVLIGLAHAEDRFILTRDTALARRLAPDAILLIKDDEPLSQLVQTIRELGLVVDRERIFTLCTLCNMPLEKVDRDSVRDAVPEYTFTVNETYTRCGSCGRVYWTGTHRERVLRRLSDAGIIVR